MSLLEFARGPALEVALAVFCLGVLWRLGAVLLLNWQRHRSEPRESREQAALHGLAVIGSRSWPQREFIGRTGYGETLGYSYHIGLFILLFAGTPHILFWESLFGFSWPALPAAVIHVTAVLTLALMLAVLIRRVSYPVLRRLSNFDDYFSLIITLAVVVTGLLAVYHVGGRYETLLAVHILSFNALLVWFPFGKLMHAFWFFPSRFFNGYLLARKGAAR